MICEEIVHKLYVTIWIKAVLQKLFVSQMPILVSVARSVGMVIFFQSFFGDKNKHIKPDKILMSW